MKQTKYPIILILPVLLLFASSTAKGQSSNQNYVSKKTYVQPSSTNALQTIQYYDGLGRPIQTVETTPGKKSLITRIDYGTYGRESKQYLPGTSGSSTSGNYVANYSPNSLYGNDTYSYSEVQCENSPLNRVTNQYGPGTAWRTASRSVQTEYLTNKSSSYADLRCYNYSLVSSSSFKNNGFYAAGKLFVTKITDENNNISYVFKNNQEQVILQRQAVSTNNYADTYYIYNDYGNLVFVLPPEASKVLTAINYNFSLWDSNYPIIHRMCYFYEYDHRQLLQGKVIASDINFYALDKAGRIIMEETYDVPSDDARGFKFYKYDKLGRLIISGVYNGYEGTGNNSRMETARNQVKNSVITEERSSAAANYFYTWNSFPTNKNHVIITSINYYDNYTNLTVPTGLGYTFKQDYGVKSDSVKGLLTCTRHMHMSDTGVSGETTTFYYYDRKGNLVQQHSTNALGGTDKIYYAYNYSNQIVQKLIEHTSIHASSISEKYVYNYDAAKRLVKTTYSVAGNSIGGPNNNMSLSNLVTNYIYDDLGRLIRTEYPASSNNMVSYTYNLRGWMEAIQSTHLKENIYYTTSPRSNGNKYYNGNISAVRFTTPQKTNYGHVFTYNGQDFMTHASYGENTTLAADTGKYSEGIIYDLNGNVKSLSRKSNGTIVDQLTLTYTNGSNQVQTITDAMPNQNSASTMEFKKGTVSSGQYSYWVDGKLQRDLHRDICRIDYNYQAQPSLVLFRYGHRIEYLYDAAGHRLRTKHYQSRTNENLGHYYNDPKPTLTNPIITVTDYAQNKVFVNGSLQQIITEFGYVYVDNNAFRAISYLKDHLGNNRIAINQSGAKVHETAYYPSGTTMWDSGTPRKFSDKELDKTFDLNFYDFEARQYDPLTMRFTSHDPLREKYYSISPYAYCANNPVNYIDPDGREWYWDKDKTRQYDPDITSQDQLQKGQTYIGATDQVKDKKGNVTEDYRGDGSIMYSNESSGYARIWNNSQKTGNEEMGIITDNGVLVLPSWDNTPSWSKVEEYGYSFESGNLSDPVTEKKVSFSGTVHTHPNVKNPSREDYGYFGSNTPNIPFYVINLDMSIRAAIPINPNKATPLILPPRGRHIGGVIYGGYSLKNRGK